MQEGLGQRVEHAVEGDKLLKRSKIGEKPLAGSTGQDPLDKARDRLVVRPVGIDPARVDLGLLDRLLHVAVDPLAERPECCPVKWLERPGPEQRLIQQILVVTVGGHLAVDHRLLRAIVPAPPRQRGAPEPRHLRERVQASANVGAALGVVGRARQHRRRPAPQPLGILTVEGRRRATELLGITTDLVERKEPVVDVERGVLDPFRHHGAGRLLKPHHEAIPLGPVLGRGAIRVLLEQDCSDEVEDRAGRAGVPPLCLGDGRLDRGQVVLLDDPFPPGWGKGQGEGDPSPDGVRPDGVRRRALAFDRQRGQIGAIDRQGGDDLANRKGEAVQREIAVPAVLASKAFQLVAQLVDLAGQ
ncbi:MAG: hypothetical protein HYY04_08000 [Chloroflexi bacterium]|nr:hypothetical protein [Chloroflexota bacterium]